jgi:hypothetical protein
MLRRIGERAMAAQGVSGTSSLTWHGVVLNPPQNGMKDLASGKGGLPSADRIITDSNGRGHNNRHLALTLLIDRTAFARERDPSLRLQNDTVGALA